MINKKQYIRTIAIFLIVVIAMPLVIQPGHYLFIKHKHYPTQTERTINQQNTHFACAIDNYHFTEITVHPLVYKVENVAVYRTIKILFIAVHSKQEVILPFALRAPPIFS